MELPNEERVRHVFDSYCRRVLKNAANDYYEEISRRAKHELLLEDCWNIPCACDDYALDIHTYNIFGVEIPISDYETVTALNKLSEDNRVIVLAAYCVGLPDRVVAQRLKLVRRTVAYRRAKALAELRGCSYMGKPLTYEVIEKAAEGDAEAVCTVMSYYSGYISRLACRYGHHDVEACCRMESKLVSALLKFRVE